jgi:hypothetical protein
VTDAAHLPAIPDRLAKAVRGRVRLKKLTPTIVVTDEIEFNYEDLRGTTPDDLMHYLRVGLQKHFNLPADRIGLVKRRGQQSNKMYFALTANLGASQRDPSVAMATAQPEVPDYIDI